MLAATVFAATAAISLSGLASHAVQVQLERTPAAAHGQWWRIFTSLFVQDSVPAAVIATGAFLAAVRNIHGAALLAGLLLAFVPVKPTARDSRPPARGVQTRT